ncbi:MAG: ATP-binding protein [Bacteroidetes bacterium]|nr:ATP-binding protein [Bacteroidota bacterium]
MGFNRFRFSTILRITLLLMNGGVLIFILINFNLPFTCTLLIALISGQIIDLINYVERTNKKLISFLESIKYNDFTTTFNDNNLGPSFKKLNLSFNNVMTEFRKSRTEKEEHFNYLQTIVQHISIGIIVFTHNGKVNLTNDAFLRIMKISSLRNLHELEQINKDLPDTLLKLTGGDKTLIKLFLDDNISQLSIYSTVFKMHGEEFILVSLQDISSVLEEKEVESWQKLIRVLTHEIMNSITPISSLAQTVREIMLEENEKLAALRPLEQEDLDNIANALDTIQRRSQGLLNFVELYRNLTRIPRPNFRYFSLKDLVIRVRQLMLSRFEKDHISFHVIINPEDLMLTADPDLIEQVLINLILNACDAVKENENPEVILSAASSNNSRITVEIRDNGTGIKPDLLDKIFMPFFTSKRNGSGIGLSLSRQIMHLHKGTIHVKSNPGHSTSFTLSF